ncbi:MAG TPA: acyltransferase domain-containing protein, partial [Woeseiaceae bacterium]|nr:acyltransferase domain-containing protein [Woeseiaceae bacterium]
MLAAVFPGQGSQSIGMMADFYNASDEVKNLFDEASSILGYDLWKLIQSGSEEKLNKTIYTQPAMLVSGVAAWSYFKLHFNISPNLMAGHSLGEYSALVCSGTLKFSDAVYIVKNRAEYMQNAVPKNMGAMAAIIGLDDDAVVKLCVEAQG